jgi:hypothetical protein
MLQSQKRRSEKKQTLRKRKTQRRADLVRKREKRKGAKAFSSVPMKRKRSERVSLRRKVLKSGKSLRAYPGLVRLMSRELF